MFTGVSLPSFVDFQEAVDIAVGRWIEGQKKVHLPNNAEEDEPAVEDPPGVTHFRNASRKLLDLINSHRLLVFAATPDGRMGDLVEVVTPGDVVGYRREFRKWFVHRGQLISVLEDHFPARRGRKKGTRDFVEEQVIAIAAGTLRRDPTIRRIPLIRELAAKLNILPDEEHDEDRQRLIERIKAGVDEIEPPSPKKGRSRN